MANIFSITCPAECTTAILPVLPAVTGCQLGASLSEIDMVVFQGSAAGPDDMSDSADWATLIDNTEALGVKMKYLIGVGSITAPEDTIQTFARGQDVITTRTYTMTFTVFDISVASIYDFCRKIQCGSIKPKIFYTDRAGFLYGKTGTPDEGITTTSILVAMPKDAGKEGQNKAIFTIKWEGKTDPDRVVNPLTL